MTSNEQFAEYVTSTSFHLSLSRNQIYWLTAIYNETVPLRDHIDADACRHMVGRYDPVNAFRGLERRGLVYAPDPQWPGHKKLTEAGVAVMELLKIAGLVQLQEVEAA